jgi:flagellar basal-body rod protein FlgB
MDWLSQRYAVTARNVANIDTPGFRAQQVADFQKTLGGLGVMQMVGTQFGHVALADSNVGKYDISPQKNTEVKGSGNDVSIDKEMEVIGDTSRQFAADLNLERIFQRMYISSVKG